MNPQNNLSLLVKALLRAAWEEFDKEGFEA